MELASGVNRKAFGVHQMIACINSIGCVYGLKRPSSALSQSPLLAVVDGMVLVCSILVFFTCLYLGSTSCKRKSVRALSMPWLIASKNRFAYFHFTVFAIVRRNSVLKRKLNLTFKLVLLEADCARCIKV